MARAAARSLFAGVCVALVMGHTIPAQVGRPRFEPRSDEAVDRGVQWVTAILQHQPGDRDEAVQEIAGWDAAAVTGLEMEASVVRRLVHDPREQVFLKPDTGSGLPTELGYSKQQLERLRNAALDASMAGLDEYDLLARGVLLHTDVALLTNASGLLMHYADGRDIDVERHADHWALARTFAGWLAARSARRADVRRWYRASLATMVKGEMWNAEHANVAASQRPPDADLLYLAGSVHEGLASPSAQAAVAGVDLPANVSLAVQSAKGELRLAAPLLKQALELKPALVDARIHYGRVLTLLDRAADAIPELQRASAEAQAPEQQYDARLFLGAALEAANRPAEAGAAYAAAGALFPRAQAPRLAASLLAARYGDRATALTAIQPLLAGPGQDDDVQDPWWSYVRSAGRDADVLMAQARERLESTHSGAARR
jgi:hypothetical protein